MPLHELQERLQGRPAHQVCGHFDPLLAEHVRRLAKARQPGRMLVVEVTNPARPLLAQRARAELVAALSAVDYVLMSDRQSSAADSLDSGISERFIAHVLERHRQERTEEQRA